jgi:hypothetical protein
LLRPCDPNRASSKRSWANGGLAIWPSPPYRPSRGQSPSGHGGASKPSARRLRSLSVLPRPRSRLRPGIVPASTLARPKGLESMLAAPGPRSLPTLPLIYGHHNFSNPRKELPMKRTKDVTRASPPVAEQQRGAVSRSDPSPIQPPPENPADGHPQGTAGPRNHAQGARSEVAHDCPKGGPLGSPITAFDYRQFPGGRNRPSVFGRIVASLVPAAVRRPGRPICRRRESGCGRYAARGRLILNPLVPSNSAEARHRRVVPAWRIAPPISRRPARLTVLPFGLIVLPLQYSG